MRPSSRAETLPDATIREATPLGARVARDIEGQEVTSAPAVRETWGCPLCGAVYSPELNECPVDGEPLLLLSWIHTEADTLVGLVIQNRYEIESVLGRGGMGTVYQARHVSLGKRFALKVLRAEVAVDADSVQRFMQEAQITASVKHDNLADVSDCGEITGADVASLGKARLPFFVMEMLRGQSLGERLREKESIEPELALEVLRQCALGLAAAHEAGIIHRDLKPDNIFLSELEGKLVCKILDFGVAKITSRAKLTKAGTVFGTPHYMSPEQASGGTLDGRTDIYALGVVMYEAISGRVPFSSETHMGVLTKHVFETPEPIETLVPDQTKLGALGPIIMRCLEKDPDARFADALELANTVTAARTAGFSLPMARPQPALRLRAPSPVVAKAKANDHVEPSRALYVWIAAASLLAALVGLWFLFARTEPAQRVASPSASPAATSVLTRAATDAPQNASATTKIAAPLSVTAEASASSAATSTAVGAASGRAPTGPFHTPKPASTKPAKPSEVFDTW
ncbi:MAG: serine/threonine-protein kinase [Polyangiaceae bacterium]